TLYTQLVVPAGTSTIEVVVRNEWNCEDSEIFEVTVHPLPDVNFELEPTAGCAPLAINTENLSFNTPDVNYTWWLNDTPVNTNALDDYLLWESGSYVITLEAQSVQGCVATLSADLPVEVYPVPSALFSYLPENPGMLNPELELNNLSEGASTYGWSIDGDAVSEEENPELHFSFESTQVFEVCLEAISEFGCTDTHCVAIRFEEEALLYVPNAFTPDNDGINDFFIPVVTGYDPETYELLIYDRWGTLVFQSHDPRERWMGEIRNGAYYAPAGIYPWVLVLKEQFSPETVSFSGHVSLIR
ncbi:MAG: gliding motility-associated C-terminal domain-containing protein, partial [Flavobacteriales bacterium]|nr:gliding motility-associated C-terminal domain-containing protein [Flavobacteriales bacterium]